MLGAAEVGDLRRGRWVGSCSARVLTSCSVGTLGTGGWRSSFQDEDGGKDKEGKGTAGVESGLTVADLQLRTEHHTADCALAKLGCKAERDGFGGASIAHGAGEGKPGISMPLQPPSSWCLVFDKGI